MNTRSQTTIALAAIILGIVAVTHNAEACGDTRPLGTELGQHPHDLSRPSQHPGKHQARCQRQLQQRQPGHHPVFTQRQQDSRRRRTGFRFGNPRACQLEPSHTAPQCDEPGASTTNVCSVSF
jgi:hypothetical protein